MAMIGMTFILAIVWRRDGRRNSDHPPRVEVTKGQPKIYRQRNQRQPCTLPDSVPKPAHSSGNVPRLLAAPRSYLSYHLRQL